jgi:hypothetical protein
MGLQTVPRHKSKKSDACVARVRPAVRGGYTVPSEVNKRSRTPRIAKRAPIEGTSEAQARASRPRALKSG